jgi:transcriptional regulator with XRE-family HTH domain
VLQSLRDRTKAFLSKHEYSQKAMASAVGISESYLNDFLNGRRGMSVEPFAKIEHILSLKARQRKLQFYTGGNTGARMPNLQTNGKFIAGQVTFNTIDAIGDTHAQFAKFNQNETKA